MGTEHTQSREGSGGQAWLHSKEALGPLAAVLKPSVTMLCRAQYVCERVQDRTACSCYQFSPAFGTLVSLRTLKDDHIWNVIN